MKKIRREFFKSILRQRVPWFDSHQSGEMTATLSNNLERMKDGMGEKLGLQIEYILRSIFSLALGFIYSWKLSLVIVSLTPLFTIFCALTVIVKKATVADVATNSNAGAIAEEVLSCIRTVMAFNGQKQECDRYGKALHKANSAGVIRSVCAGLMNCGGDLFIFSGRALAFWYGVKLINGQEIERATIYIVFVSVVMAIFPLAKSGAQLSIIVAAVSASDSIFVIIDMVLSEISFTVNPSQTVALVGCSGCGKSTILNLLLRFYDATTGKISIDGEPIEALNISFLRKLIGLVSQEPVLFGCTIEENIRFGRMDVSHQEMVECSQMANAHGFISKLPNGYNTLVGERGIQLSGGQKQRVAIARAFVRNPKILLLDEATSALDAESERIVQEALDKAAIGRTTIIVAHRLSTVRTADQILVMDHGRIVESGQHEELIQRKGHYYQLLMAQLFTHKSIGHEIVEELYKSRKKLPDTYKAHKPAVDQGEKKDVKDLEGDAVRPATLFQIFKANSHDWPYILLGVMGTLIWGLLTTGQSLVYIFTFKALTEDMDVLNKAIVLLCILFLVAGVGQAAAACVAAFCFGKASENLSHKLRMQMFENTLAQNVEYFDDPKHCTGTISTRLATDAPNVKAVMDFRLAVALVGIIEMTGGNSLGLGLSWQLGLLGAAIPAVFMVPILITRSLRLKIQREEAKMMGEAGKVFSEAIQNVRTVQSLTREADFWEWFHSKLPPHMHIMKHANIQALSNGLSRSFISFFTLALYTFGAFLIVHGFLQPITVYQVGVVSYFACLTLISASAFLTDYFKAKFSAGLIFKMVSEKPKISLSKADLKPVLKGFLVFQDVHFSYPMRPDAEVLKGMDFTVHVGQTMALVGPSGCGKSTIISLIERFYDPDSGQIMIDGYDLRDLDTEFLRNHMSLVNQEPVLFNYSIERNIKYGLNISHQDVIEAAKLASIHNFILSLPKVKCSANTTALMGYETIVGDKGMQLSAGQKQRVAIARALVRNPKILLLDEATSALDAESEQVVQEAIDNARAGRTCIIIAHRLSTVMKADIIAVIGNGKIIETGTHSELVAKGGSYFQLIKQQTTSGI